MRTWICRLALPLVALAGSQVGHLLAYQLWLGPRAGALESHGAHTLFPVLVGAAAAGLGATLLTSLLVIGAARLLRGSGLRRSAGRPLLQTFALAFTIQLAVFLVQELVETWVAGVTPPSIAQILLWGIAGQLPVAGAAALALNWISSRIDGALAVLRSGLRRPALPRVDLLVLIPAPPPGDALRVSAQPALAKRGPPSNLLNRI